MASTGTGTARAEVAMPRLTDDMEEATLLSWLVADGGAVAHGDAIAEVETDKASVEIEADADGVLSHRFAEGASIPVASVIAVIADVHVPAAAGGASPEKNVDAPSAPAGPVSVAATTDTDAKPARPAASPVARRIAHEHGIDLRRLVGSGPNGRIVKADVLGAVEAAEFALEPAPVSADTGGAAPAAALPGRSEREHGARGRSVRIEPTRLQAVVARRMLESKAEQPDFSISVVVDMDAASAMRDQLRAEAQAIDVPAFSYNDMVVRASALALQRFPQANASFVDGAFLRHERVNVGVAVAAQGALVVPTIFDTDRKSLTEIGATVRDLAGRVRDGRVGPADLDGGTFTVSNLGMYGVSAFTAVINPPQAAILAVGAVVEEPVARGGEVTIGKRMTLTLSCDHRILYGADAAEFLACVRSFLTSPWSLVLDTGATPGTHPL